MTGIASTRVLRIRTSKGQSAFQAVCVSPGDQDWSLSPRNPDHGLEERLAHELERLGSREVFFLTRGADSPGIIHPDALCHEWNLPGGTTVWHNPDRPAEALWLKHRQTVMMENDGAPLLLAHSGSYFVVGTYAENVIPLMVSALLNRGVPPNEVCITGLFGAPDTIKNHYLDIKAKCVDLGVKSRYEYRLSLECAMTNHPVPSLGRRRNLVLLRVA